MSHTWTSGLELYASHERGRAKGYVEERALVVKWLRESADGLLDVSPEGAAALRGAANEIECVDHRKEVET